MSAPDARDTRWSRGLPSNIVALAVVGSTGLVVNVLIAGRWGPEGLGVFAQTLTWFILAAQVASLGVHYAVLHRVGAARDDAAARAVVAAGIGAVAPVAVAVAVLSAMLAPAVGAALRSPATGDSIRLVSLALVLHALTKVLAAGLNGRQRMHRFAAVSVGRAVGLASAVVGLGLLDAPATRLGLIIVCSEGMALLVAAAVSGPLPVLRTGVSRAEMLRFGVRAAPAALAAEANTRVDVAMLGLLLDDRAVGVYALAVTAYEGVFQAAVVLRNQVNGPITRALGAGRPHDVEMLHRRLQGPLLASSVALIVLVAVMFAPMVRFLDLPDPFLAARGPLIVLLAGIVLAASLVPFDQILILGGAPATQARIVLASISVNVAVNLLLIPRLGAIGAAAGTALALLVLVNGVAVRAGPLLGVRLRGSLGFPLTRGEPTSRRGRP